jgi:glycosyltransferase involved in cell wall biosynthesis
MKIAIIQPRTSYFLSGSEKISLKHSEFLAKLGHTIDLYTSDFNGIQQTSLFKDFLNKKNKDVNIYYYDSSKLIPGIYEVEPDREHKRWHEESITFDRLIFEDLNKNKPDIILSYYLPDCILKPSMIPNVVYLSGYSKDPVPYYEKYIESCNATISISKIVSEKWSKETEKVKFNYVLGTGVDYPIVVQSKILSKTKYNLVYAGRLIERKGILTLIDAFKEIIKVNEDVHLWILGDGELRNDVKEKIKTFSLEEKVTMTGLVDNPYDYFNIADICIFPSHEGDGLMGTVLESMALGKAVIATTDNGNEDVITNDVNGILIEPKNTQAIVSEVLFLIEDSTKRNSLGDNAKDFISQKVAWEKNVVELSDILEDIINKTKINFVK